MSFCGAFHSERYSVISFRYVQRIPGAVVGSAVEVRQTSVSLKYIRARRSLMMCESLCVQRHVLGGVEDYSQLPALTDDGEVDGHAVELTVGGRVFACSIVSNAGQKRRLMTIPSD